MTRQTHSAGVNNNQNDDQIRPQCMTCPCSATLRLPLCTAAVLGLSAGQRGTFILTKLLFDACSMRVGGVVGQVLD